jgi:hypothetical protein
MTFQGCSRSESFPGVPIIMRDQADIKRVLSEKVEFARVAYESAQMEFRGAIADIPSSLPPPDGTGRIRIAGDSYRFAMRAYSEALREINEFLSQGRIPDRLREDEKAVAGSK